MLGTHQENNSLTFSIEKLELKARELRATCIQLAFDGKQGHLNGAMSSIDLLVALYYTWLRVSPENLEDFSRDRFIFSKGHACKSLYAVLGDRGFFPREWLSEYARNDSPLPSHPCKHGLAALEVSSGSLGHGLGLAAGMAYGLKLESNAARCVALLSDGDCNEGSTWEAAMFAAAHKLDSVVAIVDNNNVQSVGRTPGLTGNTSFEEKFRAFGWASKTIDGHDIEQIIHTLQKVPFEKRRPTAIIARTKAGAGVSFMEDQVLWHYRTPSADELQRALSELNAQPIYGRAKR